MFAESAGILRDCLQTLIPDTDNADTGSCASNIVLRPYWVQI
uniref:Uncharacterized protein n=1 Tax=Eubacterium cellulosolvens (strain ATCC 43171 / JCM 9499 / 6) TaxID=633697 RepID=I5AS26_EUBC6